MAPGRTLRLLILDDDPTMRDVLRAMLSLRGWEVLTAPTKEAALGLADDLSPDVVVLDVTRGSDGLEVCRRLKERPAAPKVVILAGKASPEHHLEGLAAGADAYVPKPFSPLHLLRVVCGEDAPEVAM